MSLKPLIAICGTTGVGKSRLAVELALALSSTSAQSHTLGARVINADAMQVYEGLDILTNKIPVEEQKGVEHLLMGFKKPGEQYVVGEWIKDATRAIEDIHREGSIPIVVGGTSYWVHHLLFPSSLPSARKPSESDLISSNVISNIVQDLPLELMALYNNLPSEPPSAKNSPEGAFCLYTLLSRLDPRMAARWHWRDTRKVLRNLQIIKEHGRPASDVISDAFGSSISEKYRSLIFWLYAESNVLNRRLDERVDDMLTQGLLEEVRVLRSSEQGRRPDVTSGVYQAIGFREVCGYLDGGGDLGSVVDRDNAIAGMKLNTRRYAQRQIKWIRNKLLPAVQEANTASLQSMGRLNTYVYLLDATKPGPDWERDVLGRAVNITNAFISDKVLPDPRSLSEIARTLLMVPNRSSNPIEVLKTRQKVTCPICTIQTERPVMLEGGLEWEVHCRTRAHRRLLRNAPGTARKQCEQLSESREVGRHNDLLSNEVEEG